MSNILEVLGCVPSPSLFRFTARETISSCGANIALVSQFDTEDVHVPVDRALYPRTCGGIFWN